LDQTVIATSVTRVTARLADVFCPPLREFASGRDRFRSLVHPVLVGDFESSALHHVCVGGLGWVADAPKVPSSHRLFSLTR
jgi:hypothetical protein